VGNYLNSMAIILLALLFSANLNSDAPPISVDKYTVVIIEETETRHHLPKSQLSAINSSVWRDYVKENNGQWRVLDQHADTSEDYDWVKQSLEVKRNGLPWLIFANKERGGSMPLPENLELLMSEIKQ